MITYVSAPYSKDGSPVGVASMDISLTGLYSMINEFVASAKETYFILTDSNGNIMMHQNEEFNPTPERILNIKDVMGGKYCTSTVSQTPMKDYDGKKVYVVSSEIGDTGWTLYLLQSSSVYTNNLRRLVILFTAIFLIGFVTVIVVTYFVSDSIVKPVIKVRDAAVKMASGDFNLDIKSESDDEIGQLADSIRKLCTNTNMIIEDLGQILGEMEKGNLTAKSKDANIYTGDYLKLITSIRNFRGKIIDMLTRIDEMSDQVLIDSQNVSEGARELSLGTSKQAASIDELSSSIREVTDKINSNAYSAEQAMSKTKEAGGQMKSATEKMRELLSAMAEARECSSKIGKIIKTIEDIALQTNILALNASIEAARAGESGKGFAVVADEVRSLASKSTEAANNTSILIASTISSVELGNELVTEVADMMSLVSKASSKAADLNTDICSSSSDAADSIVKINKGVESISDVVQESAAAAQHSAAATETLSGQANSLKKLVGEFNLKH